MVDPGPDPSQPVAYVSVYVFAGPGGLTLIDTGYCEEGWTALTTGLTAIGGDITDVRGVLVTHMHFDHIGLAKRVREASGAWIALHEADRDVLVRPRFRNADARVIVEAAWLRALGASAEEAAATVAVDDFDAFSAIALPDRLLADGEIADAPGWTLRAVHTPGHLCFAEERTGLLFPVNMCCPASTPTSRPTTTTTSIPSVTSCNRSRRCGRSSRPRCFPPMSGASGAWPSASIS